MAMIMIPTKIHTMQNIRAKNDLGARSPYLEKTVWNFRISINEEILLKDRY